MSLGRRLFNLARAELGSAIRALQDDPQDRTEELRRLEEELARYDEEEQMAQREKRDPFPPEICRYYGNLELPVGASAAEVRAAYRRLMRNYHPDRHHGDPKRQEIANQLSQELRTAYEQLLAHLEPAGR